MVYALYEALRTVAEREPESPQVGEWIEMLYDQALLTLVYLEVYQADRKSVV